MYTDLIQLEKELDEFLYHFGYQVIDLQSAGLGRNRIFRLFVERVDHEPVTIDDCGSVAPQVVLFLEQKRVYTDNCSLEVSSGGLDRLLKHNRDLEQYIGSRIRVTFHENGQKSTVEGELLSFTDEVVMLSLTNASADASALAVSRANVEKMRLAPVLEF
jgi:ribosome maturation factor RimP